MSRMRKPSVSAVRSAFSAASIRSAFSAASVRSALCAPRVRSALSAPRVRSALSAPRVRDAFSGSRLRAGVGVAIITPVVLAGSVAGSAQITKATLRNAAVTPLAAVQPSPSTRSGASVVAVTKTPTAFHIASTTASSPRPPRW